MSLILLTRTLKSNFHIDFSKCMAGHSKWANIKHIKALKDGQRAAVFTKLSRQIRLSIQEGGSANPAINSNLRCVIDEAIKKNMPMSTIQNTIKKCESQKAQLKKHILEIRVNSIFLVCILYTDNFPSLKMNLAPILKKVGAAYTETLHLFDDNGVVETTIKDDLKGKSATELEEHCTDDAIDCGAEDVEIVDIDNGIVNFICKPVEVTRISRLLAGKGYGIENAEHVFIPKNYVTLSDSDAKAYAAFREKLKNTEGLEEIYDNLDSEH